MLVTLRSTNGLSLFPCKTLAPLREIPSSCVFACDPSRPALPGVWLSSVLGDPDVPARSRRFQRLPPSPIKEYLANPFHPSQDIINGLAPSPNEVSTDNLRNEIRGHLQHFLKRRLL